MGQPLPWLHVTLWWVDHGRLAKYRDIFIMRTARGGEADKPTPAPGDRGAESDNTARGQSACP